MKKVILIFGGNGFIGSETVEYLLDNNDNLDIILVNRGNWQDWDQKLRIKSRILKNIICDRKKESLKFSLKDYLEDKNFKFEAIIDFSAYKKRVIKKAFEDIPIEKIKLYILISTDSVYEVCQTYGKDKLNETDSIRPMSEIERKKAKKIDSYGHHKLKCEEEIIKYSQTKGLSYVILRLPDVLGQRDSTNRFWSYQMWLQYLFYSYPNQKLDIYIPKKLHDLKTSYVYVKDVAKIVNQIMNSNIKNEIFNIDLSKKGYESSISLKDFYNLIADQIDNSFRQNLSFVEIDEENSEKLFDAGFPSVTKGSLNIEKIKNSLNFQASDLNQSFKEIVEFYDEAYSKFPKQRKSIEYDIKRDIIKNKNQLAKFDEFIKQKLDKTNI